jgi:prevent-host-death family protein
MNDPIPKSQFKARALEYFRQVESTGRPLIVSDHGRPVLEVRPYQITKPTPLQALKGSLLRYQRPTDPVGEDDWDAMR